jgi:ABC transporter DrrB family efflux protein
MRKRMGERPAIEAHGLRKRFGPTQALDGLDLEASEGAILGILGPNGAGKTTAFRILTTLSKPDSGWARVAGHDVAADAEAVRRNIGVIAQHATVDEMLTGRQNLTTIGRLSGLGRAVTRRRTSELLEEFDLLDAGDRVVKGYSGGMRRRLDLAVGLLTFPQVVFLDEPTTGLDPASRARMWDVMRQLVAGGTTLLLTTQYLDEADQLADAIVVVDRGRAIAQGTAVQLKSRVGGARLEVTVSDPHRGAAGVLERFATGPMSVSHDVRRLRVPVRNEPGLATSVLRAFDSAGIAIEDVQVRQPSLDDVFFVLTGHGTASPSNGDARPDGDGDRSRSGAAPPGPVARTTGLAPAARPPRERAAREAVRDVVVLAGRNMAHVAREPLRLSDVVIQPVLFTLLFVYVFGAGVVLPGAASYADFAIAGLLSLNLTTAAIGTAVGLSSDLSSGVVDRFRVLPIWKPAVLVGRSLTDLLAATVCTAMVAATGLAVGWRPHADVASVGAAFALFLLFSYALSWGCMCIGLLSKDAESSQGVGLVVLLPLALVSNAVVASQRMPSLLRTIADWNPVSAVTAAGRRLLGNPNPSGAVHAWPMQHAVLASLLSSAAAIAVLASLATLLYRRRTAD